MDDLDLVAVRLLQAHPLTPARLVDRIDLLLAYGTLSAETRSAMLEAVNSVPINAANPAPGRQNRVYLAALFAVSAPEFLVQK